MTSQGSQRIRDSLIGTALVGEGGTRFYLRDLLGEGGQGWVYRANYDTPDGFWIVVKILRPEGLNQETLERFARETRVLQVLGSAATPNPNIVRFYDHGIHNLRLYSAEFMLPFIALEFVDGPTLAHVIEAAHGVGLPLERVIRLLRQVARALATVHERQIVHRDLKPSNILLATQGGREVAKITDFGLVKAPGLAAKSTATIAGASLGYAPPEQYEMGNSRVSPRTDVFSFATILFEMLSGRLAFPHNPGDSPLRTVARMLSGERPQLVRHLPAVTPELRVHTQALAAIDREIALATDADPGRRHAGVMDLWNSVEPILRSACGEDGRRVSVGGIAPVSGPRPWAFIARAPAMSNDRVRFAAFSKRDGVVTALGINAIYVAMQGRWHPLSLPAGLDVRRIRGLVERPRGDLVVFGDGGLIVSLDRSGRVEALPNPGPDFNWYGAFTDDGDCVLSGEFRSRPVGVVAEVGSQAVQVHAVQGATRFNAATRLASGTLLAAGNHGDLVQIAGNQHSAVPWGKTGHLLSVARNQYGGAYTVGSGGHALSITMGTSLTSDAPGELTATLEVVQTTQDLVGVTIDARGVAWAIGQSARLLERRAGVWTRVVVDGTSANLVGISVEGGRLSLISEDGALLEGSGGDDGASWA